MTDLYRHQVESARDRFRSKVVVEDEERVAGLGPCWTWSGTVSRLTGYGSIQCGGRGLQAHRVSWALDRGDITDGLFVLHRCDVRPCVRPDHLFLGTHSDNMLDCSRKGRMATCPPEKKARGDRNGARLHPERHPRGESSGKAKLTEALVRQIRIDHANGRSIKGLAKEHSVSRPTIKMVITRKTWAHVD